MQVQFHALDLRVVGALCLFHGGDALGTYGKFMVEVVKFVIALHGHAFSLAQ